MALRNQRVPAPPKGSREAYEFSYTRGRSNLLIVAAVTLVNVFLALTGSNTYFLFSASIPYYVAAFGRFDYEIYGILSYLIVSGMIAATLTAVYFLFWGMAKRRRGWMYAAAVCFALDSVGLILLNLDLGFASSDILDYLFHVYVMYYLITGSIAAHKLAKMPPPETASSDYSVPVMVDETLTAPAANESPAEELPAQETPAAESSAEEAPAMLAESPVGETEDVPQPEGLNDYRGQTIPANYYRGLEAVGGKLSFDDTGMTFHSHAFNIQTGEARIEYKDIDRAQTRGLLTEISVFTKDGQDHRFVVYHRNDVIAYLERVKG